MDDGKQKSQAAGAEEPTRERAPGIPEEAPDAIERAAADEAHPAEPLREGDEKTALDFLLGRTRRPEYDVPVDFDTPEGMMELVFHIVALDDRKILAYENEFTDEKTGKFDDVGFNCRVVFEALDEGNGYITDASGRKIDVNSKAFKGDETIPGPLAIEKRFKYQHGLLAGVATEVRRLGGWSADRVKKGRRTPAQALERAVGNSSG